MVTDEQAREICHLADDQPVTDADRKVTAADFNGTETPIPFKYIENPTRKEVLANYLDCDVDDLDGDDDDESFELGSKEYLILTDSEADEKAAEYIKDSLWAFNASFLAGYCDLPQEVFEAMQDKCEGANDAFLSLVERADGGLEGLVEEAISADGRGHFLSTYDGNENEEGDYFIYRVN